MKIDGDKPVIRPEPADQAERSERTTVVSTGAAATPTLPTARRDQLQISADVQLVKAALDAAVNSPAVRGDAVERARALLLQGGVGVDVSRLADAIIDSWLGSL